MGVLHVKGRCRLRSVKVMNVIDVVETGHMLETFAGRVLVVLENGRVYDMRKRKEIFITKIFKEIRYVKNSDGIIIGKREKKGGRLMQVGRLKLVE